MLSHVAIKKELAKLKNDIPMCLMVAMNYIIDKKTWIYHTYIIIICCKLCTFIAYTNYVSSPSPPSKPAPMTKQLMGKIV